MIYKWEEKDIVFGTHIHSVKSWHKYVIGWTWIDDIKFFTLSLINGDGFVLSFLTIEDILSFINDKNFKPVEDVNEM